MLLVYYSLHAPLERLRLALPPSSCGARGPGRRRAAERARAASAGVTLRPAALVSWRGVALLGVPARVRCGRERILLPFPLLHRLPALRPWNVNLINYLRPLLIVLLSPLVLPGSRLRPNICSARRWAWRRLLDRHGCRLPPATQHMPATRLRRRSAYLGALFAAHPASTAFPVGRAFCLLSGCWRWVYFTAGGSLQAFTALTPLSGCSYFWWARPDGSGLFLLDAVSSAATRADRAWPYLPPALHPQPGAFRRQA